MLLRPVTLAHDLLGQPLPWDLYTVTGVLVASAGTTLESQEQLSKLADRQLFRKTGSAAGDLDVGGRITTLANDFPGLLKATGTYRLEPLIRRMAKEFITLAEHDHDACMGLLQLIPIPDLAVRHCLLTALVALDMAQQSLPADSPELEAVVCAALTMNLSAMRMHAELAEQRTVINGAQRYSIRKHPEDSLKLLQVGGLRDQVWLDAVAQHHENMDGSGYPDGLRGEDIALGARIIRIADFYAAKIRGRRYRASLSARVAFKHIFGDERSRLDSKLSLQLLHRIGLYPPGTLVRLASRELAVVTRKQGKGETPGVVVAFMGPSGRLLHELQERNTAQTSYAILNVTESEFHWPDVKWTTFWGYQEAEKQPQLDG